MSSKISKLMQWASFIRDIGLLFGIPILIGVGINLYNMQIDALKTQNTLLKETQFDRALSLLKGQKETYEIERQNLLKKIETLKKDKKDNLEEINKLKRKSDDLKLRSDKLTKGIENIKKGLGGDVTVVSKSGTKITVNCPPGSTSTVVCSNNTDECIGYCSEGSEQ